MWDRGSEFKKFTNIFDTIRWTNYGVYRFSSTFNITTTRTDRIATYRTITDVLQLRTAIGVTGDELECDGTDVVQTRDLRGKIKPSIRLENIWLKRKHIRFHSTCKHLFFK